MINTICWLWLATKLSAPKWLVWFLAVNLGLDVLTIILKAAVYDG